MNRSFLRPTVFTMVLAAQPLTADAQPRIRIPQQIASKPAEVVPATASAPQTNSESVQMRLDDAAPAAAQFSEPVHELPAFVLDPYDDAPPAAIFGPFQSTCPPETWASPMPAATGAPFRFNVFGEYLLLQPGNAALTSFALPINGAIVPAPEPRVPIGPVTKLSASYESGFRAGLGFRPSQHSEWEATYTMFESDTAASTAIDPTGNVVLRSLVVHPATTSADTAFLDAAASSSLDFQLADVDYRYHLADCPYSLVVVLGGRYAHLEQDFNSRFTNVTTIEDVITSIRFDGGGIRTGLVGEWRSPSNGFLVYGRGLASFLAGRFQSSFTQQDNLVGILASTSQDDERIVPTLDIELGLGWSNISNRWRFSAGYLFSAWYNVVSTSELIQAVHTAQFDDVGDTLTLDGFVTRAEVRF